jgi:hypothetical protein
MVALVLVVGVVGYLLFHQFVYGSIAVVVVAIGIYNQRGDHRSRRI